MIFELRISKFSIFLEESSFKIHGIIQQINKEAPLILTLSTDKKYLKKIVDFSQTFCGEEDFKNFQL